MKKFRPFTFIVVLWFIALMGQPVAFAAEGKLVKDTIDSPSLEGNPLGDPATRNITIYLPPSYDKGGSFPVVYLLHGYIGNETTFVAEDTTYWNFFPTGTDFPENGFSGMLDDLIAAGKLKEMIVVMPDASNKYGGSWYTNSEVIGNYEDYIVSDLVGYIDTHYHTIPSPDSRAIVGHSMGGYGAMKLAMKHPAVFGAVAAHSAEPLSVELRKFVIPIVLEENPDVLVGPNLEISAANQERFLTSLFYSSGAAFSPNLENPPFFVDLPFEYPSGVIIDEVWEKWLAHDPLTMLETYGENLASLRGVYFDIGNQDEFGLQPHSEVFHQALTEAGIAHEYQTYDDGGHFNRIFERLTISLSFISDALVAEEEPEEDFSNVFFTSLSEGLNMISLPLKPPTPLTARSFAEPLSSTVVIKYDEIRRRFVGFSLDAPGDGFLIEGGKGYIVNVLADETVTFVGAAWTNPPPVEASPPLKVGSPDSAWAFVVTGRIPDETAAHENTDGYLVTVQNTRTNVIATDVVRSGYFAVAFADLSRQSVVEVGDRLEVTVSDRNGAVASDRLLVTVTPEVIRQVVLPITLNSVGKPSLSLLLQNYPNPFNPETWIPYQLHSSTPVVIRIYNTRGNLVRALDLGMQSAGFYQSRARAAYWDGRNDIGETVASGVYFYQLRSEDFSATRRMLILK